MTARDTHAGSCTLRFMRRTIRIACGDITRWTADALVTSSNPGLVGNARPEFWRHRVPRRRQETMAATTAGYPRAQANRDGTGVPYLNIDGQIHAAAGPQLQAALSALAAPRYRKLAFDRTKPWRGALVPAKTGPSAGGLVACLAGEAVHTRSFGALTRYTDIIVHAVAPDGRGPLAKDEQSQALLQETYSSAIATAHDAGASSLALPSLGCGVNNWEPASAAAAAMRAVSLLSDPSYLERMERLDFVLQSLPAWEAFRAEARAQFGEPTVVCGEAESSKGSGIDVWRVVSCGSLFQAQEERPPADPKAADPKPGEGQQQPLSNSGIGGSGNSTSNSSSGSGSDSSSSFSTSSSCSGSGSSDAHGGSGGAHGGSGGANGGSSCSSAADMEPTLAAMVVNSSSDAIVHICRHGRIRTWNLGASEIFGISASEALGRDLTQLVIPPHIHHIRPLDVKPQYDRRHLRRAPAVRRDGSSFTAEFTVSPLGAEEPEGAEGAASRAEARENKAADEVELRPEDGVVIVLRDASEMGETVRKLRTRVAELEAGMQRLVEMARPPPGA